MDLEPDVGRGRKRAVQNADCKRVSEGRKKIVRIKNITAELPAKRVERKKDHGKGY